MSLCLDKSFVDQGLSKSTCVSINVEYCDECAPFKNFKVRQNFRPGLSETAKKIMRDRDTARRSIPSAKQEDKPVLQAKYKQLRNRVVCQIRNDTLKRNGDRIAKAENEGETWRIINKIIKPKSEEKIVINTPDGELSSEAEVAEAFNKFFVNKIEGLKEKIDPSYIKDPLDKIREKAKNKNLSFKLKTVTLTAVKKSIIITFISLK